MREVLFRGKSKKNGEWVTGRGVDVNWVDAYIVIPQIDGSVGWCGVEEIEVEPTTVSQYTGITDKNGTKIFEGDIIKNGSIDCVVMWCDRNARYMLYADGNPMISLNDLVMQYLIIVGNIWDNK